MMKERKKIKGGLDMETEMPVISGNFLERPNRFVAYIELNGVRTKCHVKNTGRCRELLTPGAQVYCRFDPNPARKTHYDLISVEKNGRLINIDAQAPNHAAMEWLASGGLGPLEALRAEVVYEDSRFDFGFQRLGQQGFLEVKGVTLEKNGAVRFPDAPTSRGVKHLRGLIRATKEGYWSGVLFVIQMRGVLYMEPNEETDPAFAAALREADRAGVHIMAMDCDVTPGTMRICTPVPVFYK